MSITRPTSFDEITYPINERPAKGELQEVAPGVFWLAMPMSGSLAFINLYLLEDRSIDSADAPPGDVAGDDYSESSKTASDEDDDYLDGFADIGLGATPSDYGEEMVSTDTVDTAIDGPRESDVSDRSH